MYVRVTTEKSEKKFTYDRGVKRMHDAHARLHNTPTLLLLKYGDTNKGSPGYWY